MAPRIRNIGTRSIGERVVSFRNTCAPCSLNEGDSRIFAKIYGTPIKNG